MNQEPDNYDLEPSGSSSASGRPTNTDPAPERKALDPIELEEPPPRPSRPFAPPSAEPDVPSGTGPDKPGVKDLDVCPNCGASMRGADTLICLRCGFDLKTMRPVRTVTGEVHVRPEAIAGEMDERPAMVKEQTWDRWLPWAMAGTGAIVLIIGHLAGAVGLFPALERAAIAEGVAVQISASERFLGLLRFAALTGMWAVCGTAALAFTAMLLGMRFVERTDGVRVALVRMLGIVALMRVASLINIAQPAFEWVLEAIVQAGIFLGLSMVLFRLKPRDLPTMGIATVVLFLVLWLLANLMVWATG